MVWLTQALRPDIGQLHLPQPNSCGSNNFFMKWFTTFLSANPVYHQRSYYFIRNHVGDESLVLCDVCFLDQIFDSFTKAIGTHRFQTLSYKPHDYSHPLTCGGMKKFIHIVASLEQVLDLNKTSFEDIIGRLKAYEERVADEDDETQGEQDKLMYANSDNQSDQPTQDQTGFNGGRGRNGQGRGRGRGRGRSNGTKDLSKIQCFRCDKFGHYASSCPDRLLKLQETQANDQNDS
ncbi:hypothetical protein V2J09_006112 [Rumex salicifolius]